MFKVISTRVEFESVGGGSVATGGDSQEWFALINFKCKLISILSLDHQDMTDIYGLSKDELIDHSVALTLVLPDEYRKSLSLMNIVRCVVETGDDDKAIEIAGRIPDEFIKSLSLMDIVKVVLGKKDVNKAQQALELITDETIKPNCLIEIAKVLVDIRDFAQAEYMCDQAIAVAVGTSNEQVKSACSRDVVKVLLEIGNFTKVIEIVDLISNGYDVWNCLNDITEFLASTEDFAQAGDACHKVIEMALSLPDVFKSTSLVKIVSFLLKKEEFNKVLETVSLITDETIKFNCLIDIAKVLIAKGDVAQADCICDQALEVAERIPDESHKSYLLEHIAKRVAEIKADVSVS